VPEKADARQGQDDPHLLEQLGEATLESTRSFESALGFIGLVILASGRYLSGRARFRLVDLSLLFRQAGWDALPVVSLINLLVGMILAFVGAAQLQAYGATIYVADLVSIAMVRDLAAIMTAIVMAGRSGAAYAAQIGTMNASQEIDALHTLGIDPVDFLVLPRMLALTMMVPLLTLYGDFMGILGGGLVSSGMIGLSPTTYVEQARSALTIGLFAGGVFKAGVYGALVAFAGCLQGLQAERSAEGVGAATTKAVVWSVVLIIAAAGSFAVIFYVLGW
jgi:phospholipid/cholesterol/gamma-HCH transport system permease protein